MFRFSIFSVLSVILFSSCSTHEAKNNEMVGEKANALVSKYCLNNAPSIGFIDSLEIFEGGFSGLHYIEESDLEFFTVNDRGPNIEVNTHPNANGKNIKFFPFDNYSQKLLHLKITSDELQLINTIPLKANDSTFFTGLNGSVENEDEISWKNLNGEVSTKSKFYLDAEGIVKDNENNFWITDEYRPAIFKFQADDMQLLKVYEPQPFTFDKSAEIPEVFKKREPNRGFEGIAFDGENTIYGMLQSPLLNPDSSVWQKSKLVRMLTLDIKTENCGFLVYEIGKPELRKETIDWKIGDMVCVAPNRFLVLEHGKFNKKKHVDIYLVDISEAKVFNEEPNLNGLTIEQSIFSEKLQEQGFKSIRKMHLLDLVANKYDVSQGKPEGLTLINDSTIAVINDNDYGLDSKKKSPYYKATNIQSCIYIYRLPSNALTKQF